MSAASPTPSSHCGTPYSYRVVDVLAKPVHSGLGTAARLQAMERMEGRWYWCWDCDTVRGNR